MEEREYSEKLLESLYRFRRISGPDRQKVLARVEQASDFEAALYSCTNLQAEELRASLEEISGTRAVDPSLMAVDPEFMDNVLHLVPLQVFLREAAFPVRHDGNTLTVAVFNPLDRRRLDRLESVSGLAVAGVVCHKEGIVAALEKHCSDRFPALPDGWKSASIEKLYEHIFAERTAYGIEDLQEQLLLCANVNHDALRQGGKVMEAFLRRHELVRYLHELIIRLVGAGCSDIHIEPQEAGLRIRSRIDGVLREVARLPSILAQPLLYRILVMSGHLPGPCREPVDGHIGYDLVPGQAVEFRVSILPSIFGEKVVMRALRRSAKKVPITDIGFDPDDMQYVHGVIHAPNGMVLVTGPTGSGKTSTLYAILDEINEIGVNIVTAEDPVERVVPGTTQVNCSPETGVSFAAALKSFLRQDPDIVMVGEVRDAETCDIALKAALTGHLVLSTLHTNDAPSAVLRLLNMGMEPFTVAASLRMIIAQRLVRRFCRKCIAEQPPDPQARDELSSAGIAVPDVIRTGKGCESCGGTGYAGRRGIFEVLRVNDAVRDAISRRAPLSEIRELAVAAGMRSLRYRGLQLVAAGGTSLQEIHRHTIEQ